MSYFNSEIYQKIYIRATAAILLISIIFSFQPRIAQAQADSNEEKKASDELLFADSHKPEIKPENEIAKQEVKTVEKKEEVKNEIVKVSNKQYKVVITFYESKVAQTDSTPCITANGFNVCDYYNKTGLEDTIAANFLKLGTRVQIPELYGERVFVVRDRMNAKYGLGRIDIWVHDHARQLGVKRANLIVLN